MALGYKSINVSNFSSQSISQRFPSYNPLHHLVFDDLAQPVGHDADDPSQPPEIPEWRSNLIALSQRDNLFFAAYGKKIHITIPQGLKQLLPDPPHLILDLPVSQDAKRIGGFIDLSIPHCVNNMLVGDLGSHEILLVACDDGDVIAFYVHTIMSCIKAESAADTVKPFFHENIGASAWGLAIHGPSRLIAASCNLRQITVFMPAYTSNDEQVDEAHLPDQIFPEVSRFSGIPSGRKSSGKKVFKLGPEGHNIPSLSFADDTNGEAHSILAVDISGNLWIFDMYAEECRRVPSIHGNSSRGDRHMGWGVLVLPLKAFKRADNPEQALGGMHSMRETFSVRKVDEKAVKLFEIHGSTTPEDHVTSSGTSRSYGIHTSPLVLEEDSEEDSDGDSWTMLEERMTERLADVLARAGSAYSIFPRARDPLPAALPPLDPPHNVHNPDDTSSAPFPPLPQLWDAIGLIRPPPSPIRTWFTTTDLANLVNMHPDDLCNITTKDELHAFLDRRSYIEPLQTARKGRHNPDATPYLLDRSAILRTYQYDLELLAPTPAVPRTVCRKLIKVHSLHHGIAGLRGFERLNLVACIPPLSLAIIASQAGRAALITLIRPDDHFSINGPVVSCRVDRFLPTREQQIEGVWPRRALMGMAVSPVQAEGAGLVTLNRWRLILHYYDHSVLSYELSRDEQTDALMVL